LKSFSPKLVAKEGILLGTNLSSRINSLRDYAKMIGIRTCPLPASREGLTVAALCWNLTSFPNHFSKIVKNFL